MQAFRVFPGRVPGVDASHAADSRDVSLTIPARPDYLVLARLALSAVCRLTPLSPEEVADLKLAITEAASNSVRHAYSDGAGTVEVLYDLQPDRLVIEVSDDGEGFDYDRRPPADLEDELTEGGLGIAIIRTIADEFELGRGPGGRGSRLRFAKRLEA
jgi:serine/threonine-protein kinase RsbW